MTARRLFTADEDAYIVANYSSTTLQGMAAHLGRAWGSVQQHIEHLIAQGRLARTDRAYHRPWTAPELSQLEELIERGLTDKAIGKQLNRSANAINVRRKRHGIPSRQKSLLSARAVSDRLGVSCAKTVAWWIRQGWLKGRKGQKAGPNRMWYVTEDALQAFVEDKRFWHLWDPENVTDAGWREYTRELRASVRFLTTGQAGKRLGYGHAAVNEWIHRFGLPAVKRGNWLIREDDLARFVPPQDRGRTTRPWTSEEDELLRELLNDELEFGPIARQLHRLTHDVLARIPVVLEVVTIRLQVAS